jgi:signal transduction histidine kinase
VSEAARADGPVALEAELRKLRRINQVLMDRIERDMDAQGSNAFSLFQAAITLEGRVAERTAELTRLTQRLMHEISVRTETERALLQAKAAAEQANLGKTRFLAAASHDLHQPLNAARLFLGTLADEVAAGRPRELVGRVETALDSVSELIGALLDISGLDAGSWAVRQTSFPIAPLLARLASEYAPQAAAHGLRLRMVPSSAVLRTDRALLARVMTNLISNAIRYTARGRILIGCRARGEQVRLEVWDTGIGIPPGQCARIFEEFQQVGTPPRPGEKGFGLGLAIVDRIARLLDLKVEVRSVPGRGSCFAVSAPRGGAAAEAAAEAPCPGDELAGLRVACIENDPPTLAALAGLLRSWGCEARCATSVAAALAGWDGEAPDLILADYHLDGLPTGTQAIAALRLRYARAIPALLLSADRAIAVLPDVAALDCGFLAKPLQPAKLRTTILFTLARAAEAGGIATED